MCLAAHLLATSACQLVGEDAEAGNRGWWAAEGWVHALGAWVQASPTTLCGDNGSVDAWLGHGVCAVCVLAYVCVCVFASSRVALATYAMWAAWPGISWPARRIGRSYTGLFAAR